MYDYALADPGGCNPSPFELKKKIELKCIETQERCKKLRKERLTFLVLIYNYVFV